MNSDEEMLENNSINSGFQQGSQDEQTDGSKSVEQPKKRTPIPQYIPPHLRRNENGDKSQEDSEAESAEDPLDKFRPSFSRYRGGFRPRGGYINQGGFCLNKHFSARNNMGYRNPMPKVHIT